MGKPDGTSSWATRACAGALAADEEAGSPRRRYPYVYTISGPGSADQRVYCGMDLVRAAGAPPPQTPGLCPLSPGPATAAVTVTNVIAVATIIPAAQIATDRSQSATVTWASLKTFLLLEAIAVFTFSRLENLVNVLRLSDSPPRPP